ncbi:MAG: DEAD/DEAH box helicase [Lachnospiraceae bacterium]|nr:DEAD/DEAH box helicase [Lachnospiraceae bacterium]
MELRDYFRIFSEEELVKGAELFFSGDIDNYSCNGSESKQKKSVDDRHRPGRKSDWTMAGRKSGSVKVSALSAGPDRAGVDHTEVFDYVPYEDTILLSGEWREQGVRTRSTVLKCSLRLKKRPFLVCESECACSMFYESTYGCPHVAALLTAYMVEEKGEEVFQGTRIETLLKNMTNVEDPFLPGVLKRTDGRLLSLLKGSESSSLPVWTENEEKIEPVGIDLSLGKGQGRIYIGVKAGTGRKRYVVQNVREFIECYQNEGVYTLGKSELQLGRRYCEAKSGDILDFMAGLYSAFAKELIRGQLFAADGASPERYMILAGAEIDSFMELADGLVLFVRNIGDKRVNLLKKGLCATLKKKAYGASLKIEKTELFFANGVVLYMYDGEDIFRVKAESTEKSQALLSLLGWNDEMYIRDSEIGSVCRNLLPVFQEYGTVITRGMDFEDYERETPEFVFNLDYPDDRVLSCMPYAVYKKQDFKCLLFDPETGQGRRNAEAETAVASYLPHLFQAFDRNTGTLYSELNEEELFDFMRDALPALERLGRVMATDTLKRNRIRSLPTLKVGVAVEGGQIRMSLHGTGLSQFEMADILGSYKKKKKYYRLKSGEFLSLESDAQGSWKTASELFDDYGKKDAQEIKIPAFRAMYLKETLEGREDSEFDATEEYRELLLNMDPERAKDSKLPPGLEQIMRPYQAEGFYWIKMLKQCGFGGILADDMGLGKTLQVLSFVLSEKLEGKKGDELRTLVVCPASLVYNWQKEIAKYTPGLSSVVIAGTAEARRALIGESLSVDVWITSYDLLKRDVKLYEKLHFANEIIDEAQFVKNQKTRAAQSVRMIDSSFRMALTGTPIENYLSELWSIMDYLMPGILFSYGKFQNEFETPIAVKKDEAVLERLRRMVHPFILRRLKKEILKELPDKLEEVITVRLQGQQKKLYDASVEEIRLMLEGVDEGGFRSGKLQFLAKLTGLRQICCDPSLIYEDFKGESAKLEACLQLIDQAVSGGHKLLLFSQFTSMLDIIEERLKAEGLLFHRIDGSVSKERRMDMVDSFANDDVPVFLISLKAGGTGLNLTAADIVIHYDPWWNKAAQNQATDRTHRIGQTERVTVYELIAEDTVEERIQKIKEGKEKLVEDVLSGGEISSASFNREDMLKLLM